MDITTTERAMETQMHGKITFKWKPLEKKLINEQVIFNKKKTTTGNR